MDLPVELLLWRAPERQRYHRAVHILFGGIGEALRASTREQILMATADSVLQGLSTRDFCQFRQWCSDHVDWCEGIYPLLQQSERAIADRAEVAIQEALAAVNCPANERTNSGTCQGPLSASKGYRLKMAEEFQLEAKLRLAEVYADIREYSTMSDIVTRLSVAVQSAWKVTIRPHRLPLCLTQLEINKRTVVLLLGCGNIEAVRTYTGESTGLLLAECAQSLTLEHGSSSVHFPFHQCGTEDAMLEIEYYLLFFSLVHALCLFESGDFDGFVRVFTAEGLRGATWSVTTSKLATKWCAARMSASFGGRISPPGTLPVISHLRCVVEEGITSGVQLGSMVLLCAIATLPRSDALALVTQMNVVQLWEDIPEAHTLIQAVQQARFADVFHAGSVLTFTYLKTDLFAHKHCECLLYRFKQTIILRFVNCYANLDLRKAAMYLSIPLQELVQFVKELIESDHLSAKIDFVTYTMAIPGDFLSPDTSAADRNLLLDCIDRSRKCTEELEQTLRLLAIRRDGTAR